MDHILPWSTCIFDTILIEMTVILPMDDKVYLLDLNTIYENDIAGIITDTQFIPGMYHIIDYKFDVIVSATVEYEFTVVILIIDGSVTQQAIGMKVNIIKQKGQGIPPSDDNHDDASQILIMYQILNIIQLLLLILF